MHQRLICRICWTTPADWKTLGSAVAGHPKREREKDKLSVLICSLMVELRGSRHCFLVKQYFLAKMFVVTENILTTNY